MSKFKVRRVYVEDDERVVEDCHRPSKEGAYEGYTLAEAEFVAHCYELDGYLDVEVIEVF